MYSLRGAAGFTLIELVTALLVVSVLASLAAPAFSAQVRQARVRAALDRFTSDVYRVRSYAASRGVRVNVALHPDVGCATTLVTRRADTGGAIDSVSLAHAAEGVCLSSNVRRAMSIDSRGMLVGSPRTVRAAAGDQRDSLSISIVGRIYRWN